VLVSGSVKDDEVSTDLVLFFQLYTVFCVHCWWAMSLCTFHVSIMCMRVLCMRVLCVRVLCVRVLCVRVLCVGVLCVRVQCVSAVCEIVALKCGTNPCV
jgi:hypothetical protein